MPLPLGRRPPERADRSAARGPWIDAAGDTAVRVQARAGARPLLPGPLRAAAAALLAACVAVTVVLGVRIVGRGLPGWLDSAFDPRIQAALSRFPSLLNWLPDFGTLGPVALMTLALVLACLATRRWTGAVAGGRRGARRHRPDRVRAQALRRGGDRTVLPQRTCHQHVRARGHLRGPARRSAAPPLPGAVRLLLVILALLLAAAVAAAMVAIGAHNFTDAVGGAAVGTGVVLACALTLDLVTSLLRRGPAARPASGG